MFIWFKMKQKLRTLVLAGFTALTLAAGCSESGDSDEHFSAEKNRTIWHKRINERRLRQKEYVNTDAQAEIEFFEDSFLHYGLGNLFFDQLHFDLPTDTAFIDRHVIYDGKYISTELLGIQFVDYARPRPMTLEERVELLERAFDASLW